MPSDGDYLEKLWIEAIDVKSKAHWIEQCLDKNGPAAADLFGTVPPVLQRMLNDGAARHNLELLAAFVRYETCFGVLCALDDPGLGKGKLAGLHKDFQTSRPTKTKSRNKRAAFIRWLWETESFVKDDGEWLRNVAEKTLSIEPFTGVFSSIQRVLEKITNLKDLGLFLGWNRYQACSIALRLLEESGIESGGEPLGLHEMLLTSFPQDETAGACKKSKAQPDPVEPFRKIRSGQAAAFSPDSKTLAVAGASGPVRLYDVATGKERLVCEGIKVHIYRIAFSSDGKQVAAGQIHKAITICDATTGKLIHKLKRTEDEISGLEYLPSGELVCSAWCKEIVVFDSKTGKPLAPLKAHEAAHMAHTLVVFGHGTRIAADWGDWADVISGKITVWSWPERERLLEIKTANAFGQCLTVSPDSKTFALASGDEGILFFDTASGKQTRQIKVKKPDKVTFTPDGSHIVFFLYDDDQLCIWDWRNLREVRRFNEKGCFSIHISPNGEYLAMANYRGLLVWRLPLLLK